MSKPVFWWKIRQNVINLSSAELAPRVAKIQLDPELDQVHVQRSCKKFCHWV